MTTPYDTEDQLLENASTSWLIRVLNDEFRTMEALLGSAIADNRVFITRGVADRGNDFVDRAMEAVRAFCDFTPDNDPYGEHDFGVFCIDGVKLNWKIDYYDNRLEFGSPDPADIAVTRRVLTILLAEEY
jgi:Protein of unknown function (DUF3768)